MTYIFNSFGKADLVLKCKTGTESGCLKQQLRCVIGFWIFLVGFDAFQQLLDNGMARIDFKNLLLIGVKVLSWILCFS